MQAALVYPHQLFPNHPALAGVELVFLVEDPLFFKQFGFHSQKLLLHRLSLTEYAERLGDDGLKSHIIPAGQLEHSGDVAVILKRAGVSQVQLVEPCDDWLLQRLSHSLSQQKIRLKLIEDPDFLTPLSEFAPFAEGKKRWYFSDFYVAQRRRLKLLLEEDGKPTGGKWSFDPANRKKLPKGTQVPSVNWPAQSKSLQKTARALRHEFPGACGHGSHFCYPTNSVQARHCLQDFLENRFIHFGDYEDAIEPDSGILFHSLLTPALNIGLLSPREVVQAAMEYSDRVPLNSLEGFIRQVIGWREYMRGVYLHLGRQQRTSNFWQHQRPMPFAFYDGSTGIDPVDTVIQRVRQTAYCHHIERLMVLGNFMLLCEISPTAIYQWFMELFIDAYDWVMVPNVYGMSQFADGGLITTKPYISGSAYILKMSNFRRGAWCEVWDALYWRFIDRHRDVFGANPRMSMMAAQCKRMGEKLNQHHRIAEDFLSRLH